MQLLRKVILKLWVIWGTVFLVVLAKGWKLYRKTEHRISREVYFSPCISPVSTKLYLQHVTQLRKVLYVHEMRQEETHIS